MIRFIKLHRVLIGTATAMALSGCPSTPVKPMEKLPLEQMTAQATEASAAGKKADALKMLDKAAIDYPGDKAPWLQKAQIKFEGGQYGEAILDAQQALARDPIDKVAHSIIAISGLRLATTALADLVRQNNLSGSLRSESQELAKLLRESIGEGILPKSDKVEKTEKTKPSTSIVRPPVKQRIKAEPASGGADPFGALKQDR